MLILLRAEQADRIAAIDRERNECDRQAGRGFDYEPRPETCRICGGKCRWCRTPGIERCGACFPERGAPSPALDSSPDDREHDDIDPAVISEIERIEAEALRLSWHVARLWGAAQFWPVQAPGLAALLEPGDTIAQVTADYIVIVKRDGAHQRFWRVTA